MGSIGLPELLLIFFIVLLIFGGKRLPEMARGLGTGIRDFKRALQENTEGK
jgi:sec-independent protein translocase protein TatA